MTRPGPDFEDRVLPVLESHFGIPLVKHRPVAIGQPPKLHKFDLSAADGGVVIECKNYSWTSGGNNPSAKLAHLNEAVLYLSHLPATCRAYLALPRSLRVAKQESLAEYYFRTYRHLLSRVTVLEVDGQSVRELGPQA